MGWTYAIPAGTFVDADNDPITCSATLADGTPLPSWLKFDPNVVPFGRFVGSPEAAGVLSGQFDLMVTATDGATSVSATFSLVLGIDGQPLYKPVNPREALVTVYDAQAPGSAGPVDVWIGLAAPSAQTMTMSVATQNGVSTNANTHYTAKTEWVVFHPGEQYKKVTIQMLQGLTGSQTVNVNLSVSGGHDISGTVARSSGQIRVTPVTLPPVDAVLSNVPPKTLAERITNKTRVHREDFLGDFQATDVGLKSDGVTAGWRDRLTHGREQTGNNEDGYYAPSTGTAATPLVMMPSGKRALKAEYIPNYITTSFKTYNYTSAVIIGHRNTATYVKPGDIVKFRVKITNPTVHTWPAVWLLPTNQQWPPEIDLMEAFYTNTTGFASPSSTHAYRATSHWFNNGSYGTARQIEDILPGFAHNDWHEWSCYLGPNYTEYFVDGLPFVMVPNKITRDYGYKEWYPLIDLAVGGIVGVPNNPTDFPVYMELDYYEVWR
jgi:hypothetical protein